MNMESHLTYYEFRQYLTPQNIRPIQIIQLALGFGIVVFGTLVLLLYYSIPTSKDHDVSNMLFIIQILTYVHVVFAIISYSVSQIVFKKLIHKDRLSKLSYDTGSSTNRTEITQPDQCLFMIRGAIILRLAMYEGVAIFGLIICLLGATQGLLQLHTGYWVNAFSAIIALGLIAKTYPSREKIERICKDAKLLTS